MSCEWKLITADHCDSLFGQIKIGNKSEMLNESYLYSETHNQYIYILFMNTKLLKKVNENLSPNHQISHSK